MATSPKTIFASMQFPYDGDAAANRAIEKRIAERARRGRTITYSELADGVTFRLPNVHGGAPFQLGALGEWTELDRAVLGSVLGRISADSYVRAGILASAVAVSKATQEPSEGFKTLVRDAGLVRTTKGDDFVLFWSAEFQKAAEWFRSQSPDH